jgi:2-desacetyl-2-hydroxyethyl bacteriochlorophyllide A dehydrogenase
VAETQQHRAVLAESTGRVMKAVVLDGRGGIEVIDKPVPVPGPKDVVIAPRASGVCGTDLHLMDGTFAYARYPVTPGHEFAGVVVDAGRDVRRWREGDLVCVDPNITCGRCRWCRSGAPNHCPELDPIGLTRDGSCAEYVLVPESVVHSLPGGVDASMGALVEPLSCVLHAASRTPGWADARVAVLGAGPIGLLAIAVARHLGAGEVVAFEPQPFRRELALTLGAETAHADASDTEEAFDIAVEASGRLSVIQRAIEMLGPRGRLLQMGVANPDDLVQVSPYEVFAKELMIIGSFSLADAYPAAVEMMPDLATVLRPLVTDQVPLSRYRDAVELLSSPTSIKVQVVPD